MNYEIIYVCHSINNKNIRANELKILRKKEKELCFEFGETEKNIKKRFYKTIEELNKDFEEVEKIKEKLEKEEKNKTEVTTEVKSEVEELEVNDFKKNKKNIF